jgi:hypothetical protein
MFVVPIVIMNHTIAVLIGLGKAVFDLISVG